MSDDILIGALQKRRAERSIIMVIGVGGAGNNALNNMYEMGVKDVVFVACNTDKQALERSSVDIRLQLGDGLGAGNDPEVGRAAAIESSEQIKHILEANGTKMLFITAGMGGGTGTGASAVIANIAKQMGILTVAIVTYPPSVEGRERRTNANTGITELKKSVDSLLVIHNDKILEIYSKLGHSISLYDAFGKADEISASATKGIAEIITVSGMVNVDFADVSRVMKNSGRAHMGVARARGENRAIEAAQMSLQSPLLGHNDVKGAKSILLNIVCKDVKRLSVDEFQKITSYVQQRASYTDANGVFNDATLIWGTSENPKLDEDELEVIIVVTGFPFNDNEHQAPTQPHFPAPDEIPHVGGGRTHDHQPVMLERPNQEYSDLASRLTTPGYIRRNAQFELSADQQTKRVHVKDEAQREQPSTNSIFDFQEE